VVEVQGSDTAVCFDSCTIEDGADADDGGFSIYDGAHVVLRGNRINAHVHSAIEIQGEGTVVDLTSNTVCGARYSGVVVREGARATLRGNNICGNSYDGVEINHKGTQVKLAHNYIHGGLRYGIRVSELASAYLSGNSVIGNDLTGVHVDFGSSVELKGNLITKNGKANKSRHTSELERYDGTLTHCLNLVLKFVLRGQVVNTTAFLGGIICSAHTLTLYAHTPLSRYSTHEQQAYKAGNGFPGVCILRGSTASFGATTPGDGQPGDNVIVGNGHCEKQIKFSSDFDLADTAALPTGHH
jgi:hypothetical protein